MRKNLLAFLVGIIVAFVIILILEGINGALFPPPEGVNFEDKAAFAKYVSELPFVAVLLVVLAHGIASFVAGIVTGKMAASQGRMLALFVGLALTFAGVYNWIMIPHPEWFKIADTLVYAPMAWLGARITSKE